MPLFLPVPPDRRVQRFVRCALGLSICGLGVSLFLQAKLGTAPWDVFHQGVARHLGIPVGMALQLTGLVLIAFWFVLGLRPGFGTIMNALLIGFTVLVVLPLIPQPSHLAIRVLMVFAGLLAFGTGTGIYIGAGLGPGPRDGLMLALAGRGISVRLARTSIEAVVVTIGYLMGGTVGFGTVVFAFGIGPVVQFMLPRLRMSSPSSDDLSVQSLA